MYIYFLRNFKKPIFQYFLSKIFLTERTFFIYFAGEIYGARSSVG